MSEPVESPMEKYQAMIDRENEALDEKLPTLGRQREEEAIDKANNVLGAVRDLIATGMLEAVGYRVVIKPVEAIKTLELAQAEVAPTLAERGFESKSDKQREREERGENHGVIIHLGATAFEKLGGIPAWADVGATVVFSRYSGTRVEHPPGSGSFYQIMNDEDIFGKIV